MVTLEARNADEAMVAPVVGSGGVCVWSKSKSQAVNFVLVPFGTNLASVVLKIFSHLINLVKTFKNVEFSA